MFTLFVVSAGSIILPVAGCILRLKRCKTTYRPLCYLFGLGLLNEIISYTLIKDQQSNLVNSNLYGLAEFELLVWLFWRLENRAPRFYIATSLTGLIVWIADHIVFHSLESNTSSFSFVSSLMIIYLCIDQVNRSLFARGPRAITRTDLLLSIGFFLFFSYHGFLVVFNMFPLGVSDHFYARLWFIKALLNILTNILLLIAVLWIPRQQPYIIRF